MLFGSGVVRGLVVALGVVVGDEGGDVGSGVFEGDEGVERCTSSRVTCARPASGADRGTAAPLAKGAGSALGPCAGGSESADGTGAGAAGTGGA